MPIVIREYGRVKRSTHGDVSHLIEGVLVTDALDLPIKVITPAAPGTAEDAPALTRLTEFVVLENKGETEVRFAVRPKGGATEVPATENHEVVAPSALVTVAVYPGAIISLLEAAAGP